MDSQQRDCVDQARDCKDYRPDRGRREPAFFSTGRSELIHAEGIGCVGHPRDLRKSSGSRGHSEMLPPYAARPRPTPEATGQATLRGPRRLRAGFSAGEPMGGTRRYPRRRSPRFRNVCISREAGAGGGTIARLAGASWSWKVYDHEDPGGRSPTAWTCSADEVGALRRTDAQASCKTGSCRSTRTLRPPGGVSRPPGQARSRRSAGRTSRSSSAGALRTSSCLVHEIAQSVRIIAPHRARGLPAGRTDGGLDPHRAPRPHASSDRRHSSSSTGPSTMSVLSRPAHLYDMVLDSNSRRLTIAAGVIVRGRRAGIAPQERTRRTSSALSCRACPARRLRWTRRRTRHAIRNSGIHQRRPSLPISRRW